jgi:hypothetical protein
MYFRRCKIIGGKNFPFTNEGGKATEAAARKKGRKEEKNRREGKKKKGPKVEGKKEAREKIF